MTRRPGAAILALLVLLLTGCATIPTSGTVQTPPPTAAADDSEIVTRPNPPAAGATPDQIVRGFVQALSEGRGYDVAKQFLTSDMAAKWRPNEKVVVHQQKWDTALVGTDRVVLTVPETGEVDGDGLYTPENRSVPLQFDLQQVRGQWRISSAPNEVVLAQFVFQRVFQPVPLQFFDPAFARFVPDLRWFPRRSDQSSAIVAALLAGTATPLAGGATASAFPDGTELARPVAVADGAVSVAVTTPDGVDDRARARMQQQLAASLPEGVALDLAVDGRAAPRTGGAEIQTPSLGDPPAVLVGGRFGVLRASGFTEDRVLGARIEATRPVAVTVSARQRLAAVLTAAGQVAVVTPSAAAKTVDTRADLVAPTLDQRGWTFSVPAGNPNGLRASSASGEIHELRTDLRGTAVVSIQVSWDGTRMLVVVDTDRGGTAAYVAGIERAPDGTPTGLTGAHYPVQLAGVEADGATWVNPTTVAVLTSGGSAGGQTVVAQQLGGPPSQLGPLSNARVIVGGARTEELRALLESGDLQVQSGNGWQREFADPVKVQVLAVQR